MNDVPRQRIVGCEPSAGGLTGPGGHGGGQGRGQDFLTGLYKVPYSPGGGLEGGGVSVDGVEQD